MDGAVKAHSEALLSNSKKQKSIIGIGEVIIDTGCSNSMVTHGRFKLLEAEFKKRGFTDTLPRYTDNSTFRVANGETAKALFAVEIPIQSVGIVKFSVVDSDCELTPPTPWLE